MDKKYTSNGQAVRILCIDGYKEDYPVVAMYLDGDIRYFTEDGESATGAHRNLVEVWEPQVGEWCWFWDHNDQKHASLYEFVKMDDVGKFTSTAGCHWKHCAQFDGTLPEHLNGE
jgi:hypothetical protein